MGKATGNPKGRPKGAVNKATAARQEEVKASGVTPLEYMLAILRDETADAAQRFEAAKQAAPYVHPKLSSVEAKLEANVKAAVRRIERVVRYPTDRDAPGIPAAPGEG